MTLNALAPILLGRAAKLTNGLNALWRKDARMRRRFVRSDNLNIRLIDLNGKLPNLALMKISAYHKQLGDSVGFTIPNPDIVYVSIVFKQKASYIKNLFPNANIVYGGSGYDLHTILTPEIESLKPDYSLYPEIDYSMGFSTRGCIRKCHFCIVPEKEGYLSIAQHPKLFHDYRFHKIMLLDNNLLADKEWFFEVSQWIMDNHLSLRENGMDIRLMSDEIAKRLSQMKFYKPIHFAFDHDKEEHAVNDGIKDLERNGINLRQNVQFFVYVDSDKQFESGLERCRKLKALGTNPFVMFNLESERTQRIKNLQRWANRKWLLWSMDFDEYKSERALDECYYE